MSNNVSGKGWYDQKTTMCKGDTDIPPAKTNVFDTVSRAIQYFIA